MKKISFKILMFRILLLTFLNINVTNPGENPTRPVASTHVHLHNIKHKPTAAVAAGNGLAMKTTTENTVPQKRSRKADLSTPVGPDAASSMQTDYHLVPSTPSGPDPMLSIPPRPDPAPSVHAGSDPASSMAGRPGPVPSTKTGPEFVTGIPAV